MSEPPEPTRPDDPNDRDANQPGDHPRGRAGGQRDDDADTDTDQFPPVDAEGRPGAQHGTPEDHFVGTAGAYYVVDEPVTIAEDELAGLRMPTGPALTSTRRALPLEDEPSAMVARYLFPTEKFRGEWKRHWVQLAKEIAIGVAATFIMGYATGWLAKHNADSMVTVAILVYAAILGWIAWQVTDWWFDRFILTNKRVMVVSGVVTRNVAMMPLLRVTDMKYVQSPLGRILNYGNFELESAGQEQALRKISNLPNPNELYLRIVEEMYEPEAVEARLGRQAEEGRAEDGT
jgi:membrane protein YdbS with pleckstrin-like domain